jgi:nucleoside-diphosphate-sugar epimerase
LDAGAAIVAGLHPEMDADPVRPGRATLLTGCTSFLGRRLLLELARSGHPALLLAQPDELPRAHAAVARVTRRHPGARGRVLLFAGDALEPGLGLPADVADRILGEASVFVHALAFAPGTRRSAESAAMASVRAAESVLAFAHRARSLEAFLHVSSVAVSGDYRGTFYEDWFDVGQGFVDALDRSAFETEARVRDARRTLPIVVVRPGIMLGDSETSEVDRAHPIGALLRALRAARFWPRWLPVPGPEGERHIVPLSPVDFVARAVLGLASLRERQGHAFCLVDPQSPTVREFLDLVAAEIGMPPARLAPAPAVQARVLSVPGLLPALARAGDSVGVPLRPLRLLLGRNRHDTARASAALAPLGLSCPPFSSYARRILAGYLRKAA